MSNMWPGFLWLICTAEPHDWSSWKHRVTAFCSAKMTHGEGGRRSHHGFIWCAEMWLMSLIILYFFTGHHRRTELPHGVTESWLLAVVLWLYMASFCRSYSRLPYSHGATPLDEAWALIPGSTWTHPEYLSPREQIPNRESLWSEVCLPLPHFLLWDLPFLLMILVKIAFLSLPKDTTLDSIARINCPSIHTKSVHTMLYS